MAHHHKPMMYSYMLKFQLISTYCLAVAQETGNVTSSRSIRKTGKIQQF